MLSAISTALFVSVNGGWARLLAAKRTLSHSTRGRKGYIGSNIRSRTGRRQLKARDRATGVALHLLDAVAARRRRRIVAPTRRTVDELECPIRLRATASRRAPIGVSTTNIRLADPELSAPDADERTSARWTGRLNRFTFCVHDSISSRHETRSRRPWPIFAQVRSRFDLVRGHPRRHMDELRLTSLHLRLPRPRESTHGRSSDQVSP